MAKREVNPERKYHNHHGQIPPLSFEKTPAEIPPANGKNEPKLITDTTMRDGSQDPTFAIFSNEAKVKYFDLLHKLDNGTGIIDCVEVFIYQKRDLWTLEKLLERGYDFPRVTTWTRANPKDIKELVKISGGKIKETGILASASDHHIFDRLSFPSKQDAIERYLVPIMTACENGIVPRVHLEDSTKADIEGWVIPFMTRVTEETKGMAKFRICDTMGLGNPDPYASLPNGIPRLISTLSQAVDAELEFHGHNDFGYAMPNSMAAFRYGCKRVNTTFGGLGERTGNTPLEQVAANYVRIYGNPGLKLGTLAEIADMMEENVARINEKQPIIGRSVFTTQAGLHQSGVLRQGRAPGGLIYLPFEPEVVGRNNAELNRIGALSGMDGLISVLNKHQEQLGLEAQPFSGVSRTIKTVYDHVHDAYDGSFDEEQNRYVKHRTTFFEVDELYEVVKKQEKGT